MSLDKQEDRKLRMDLYRFFEDHGGQGWFKKMLTSDTRKPIDLTSEEVIDVDAEETKAPEEENWGEYSEIDISSLSRDDGARMYQQCLYHNYVQGGITLAQKAEEEEEAKRGGSRQFAIPDPEDEEEYMSDASD